MRSISFVPFALVAACASGPETSATARSVAAGEVGRYRVDHILTVPVPEGAQDVRVWFPLPRLDPEQDVTDVEVVAPPGWRETTDAHGNRYVYAHVTEPSGEVRVETRFTVTRREAKHDVDPERTRPLTDAERKLFAADLAPNRHVVIDGAIEALAAEIRGSETNPVRIARKLYDWTLANVEYWVKDPSKWKASPVGSSEYCLQNRTGNCTDFHSLWTALARASGLPTRIVYGALFKPSLDGVDRDASYHCWPVFWAPELGWIPHDVAVADIYVAPIALNADNEEKVRLTVATNYEGPSPELVDYYFG